MMTYESHRSSLETENLDRVVEPEHRNPILCSAVVVEQEDND